MILFSKWKLFSYYFRFFEVWQTLLSPQPDLLSLKRPDKGTPHFHSPLGLEALPYSILCLCFFSPGSPEPGLLFFQQLTEPLHCASPSLQPPPLASLKPSEAPPPRSKSLPYDDSKLFLLFPDPQMRKPLPPKCLRAVFLPFQLPTSPLYT